MNNQTQLIIRQKDETNAYIYIFNVDDNVQTNSREEEFSGLIRDSDENYIRGFYGNNGNFYRLYTKIITMMYGVQIFRRFIRWYIDTLHTIHLVYHDDVSTQ